MELAWGCVWGGDAKAGVGWGVRDISDADGDDGVGTHSRTVNLRRQVSQNVIH
jgi:hypothetical protein